MKTSLFTTLIFFLISSVLHGQEKRLFMASEFARAYENGTRSYDGKPGSNYWQNTVDYDIQVEVAPTERKLSGTEQITYHNNSPDELNRLTIRLYHDLFRKGNARANRVQPDDVNEGVILSKLEIGGQEYDPENGREFRRNGTNGIVTLKEPLKPGASLSLLIEWSEYIPNTTIREGAFDSTSYFVAYWYPQIGVYDDVFGWDNVAYDFSEEFYNNLGNYNVRITVPDNFTVLSTGVLQNPDEVFTVDILSRFKKAKTSDETIHIVSSEDLANNFHHKSGTWHYKADEVSDFSFTISDHYSWDAANLVVDGRNVFINSFYPSDGAGECGGVVALQQKTMKHFSEDMPGVPYPYPEFTTFMHGTRGGGGMETPMMANNGGPGNGVTIHEMFHTYFPMYVRINEEKFAWMDEGWANFGTNFVTKRFFEDNNGLLFSDGARGVNNNLGTYRDLPLITSSQYTDGTNYGYSAYPLPEFLYSTLYHELGDEVFKKCLREYIHRWAKKSPTPYDFFYTFENVSGQNLSWLWKPWFFEFGTVDIQIQSFSKGQLTLENAGDRPVPLVVDITYKDGSKGQLTAKASIWKEGRIHKMSIPNEKDMSALIVNANVPDVNPLNNLFPTLQERYKSFKIADDIIGTYHIDQFRMDFPVERKDGNLMIGVMGGIYLVPKSDSEFVSLDGEMLFTFQKKDGKYYSVNFKYFGYDLTAVKSTEN